LEYTRLYEVRIEFFAYYFYIYCTRKQKTLYTISYYKVVKMKPILENIVDLIRKPSRLLIPIIGTMYITSCSSPHGDKNILSQPLSDARYRFGAIDSMYFSSGGDGSTALVWDKGDGKFLFYRDGDNNGSFDGFGFGVYNGDTARVTEEETLSTEVHMKTSVKRMN